MQTTHGSAVADEEAHADVAVHDDHGHDLPGDPNAAPMRSDVREDFSRAAVAYCAILGLIAIVAGTIIGLTVINN